MNVYRYKAKTKKNETIFGKVEATTVHEASAALRERGLFVISVTQYEESSIMKLLKFSRVKQNDVVNFTRQLSTMITAGLPLTDALLILQTQSAPAMQKIIEVVRRDVEGGQTLAKSMEKHPKIFTQVYISLVRAGESAGVLDKVLARLADTLEKQKEFSSKTKGALIYPSIVMAAMGIVGFIMMVFVIPKLTAMYKDFGAKLPGPTLVLIGISNFMSTFWYVVIGGVVGGIFLFKAYQKTPNGKLRIDRIKLKMPIFGPIQTKVALVELTRTLALLVAAGISLLTALEIVLDALENRVFRDALAQVAKNVEKGQSLSTALARSEEFPILMNQMVSVGEETGKLDEVLMKLSAYFESESEMAVKGLTTAMEPLIMIVLGVGVGFLIIAIILPIYNLTNQF